MANVYSFCEGVFATGISPWHIRRLGAKGRMSGGGIDTPSLCGRVQPPGGWDLNVTLMVESHLGHLCQKCVDVYRTEVEQSEKGSDL